MASPALGRLAGPLPTWMVASALCLVLGGWAQAAPGARGPAAPGGSPEVPAVVANWSYAGRSDAGEEQDVQKMMRGILRGLGMSKMPDVSMMNVSHEEYDRMFTVYLDAVAEGRKRHKQYYAPKEHQGGEFIIPWLSARRRYSFTSEDDGGLKRRRRRSLESNSTRPMSAIYFPVDIPEVRWRHRKAALRRATLRLLVTLPPGRQTPPQGLTVHVYQPPAHPGLSPTFLTERKVTFAVSKKGGAPSRWVDLDVTSAISQWLRDPTTNKGLLVECQGCTLQTRSPANSRDSRPVVDVLVNVRGHYSRSRRSYDMLSPRKRGRTDCRRGGEKCCRHQMEVVFHELKGFEFILQPKKFDAGFCRGRCPPRYNPAHHHALLQSLVWKQNRKLAPKPCCAPNKLKSLEILHLDEDDPTRLKVSHWEDMEVLECACS